jgi:hypothetical protein
MTLRNLASHTIAAALALCAMAGTANAAKIGVRVLDANTGLPVPHASVCLGTASNPSIYGTGVTSVAGLALYDNVPAKPVLITVSKKNFRGIALQTFPKEDNVITDVLVTEGLSSKRCRALKMVDLKPGITEGGAEPTWPMAITALSYFPSGDDGFSFLAYVKGKPTHYRVSTDPEFKGAEWKTYSDIFHFSPVGSDRGKGQLYFQLRKLIDVEGGNIEAVSDVTARPIHIGTL